MSIRFIQANPGNVNNSGPKVTLRPPDFLKEKAGFSITDSFKSSINKGRAITLTNPFLLFSLNSVNKAQAQNSGQLSIQWEKQFNDPAVAKGSAPAGYRSIHDKEIPMAKLIDAAKQILAKNQPLGTCTPVNINGQQLLAVDQTHFWTIRNGEKVNVPGGLHGVSVYIKASR